MVIVSQSSYRGLNYCMLFDNLWLEELDASRTLTSFRQLLYGDSGVESVTLMFLLTNTDIMGTWWTGYMVDQPHG